MNGGNPTQNSKRVSVFKTLYWIIALPIALLLLVYNLRRIIFSFAILLPRKKTKKYSEYSENGALPDVLILVPCRDEEKIVPGMCQALRQLDYPVEKRHIVLIDDGSIDRTEELFAKYSKGKKGWHTLSTNKNIGKASAINAALERFSFGDIIFVYDADHRPEPNSLKLAIRYFEDDHVGGVSGRTIPINTYASPSAYYATIENMVHQMVTMRAKDRLGLAPALLGSNCGYQRTALEACGGFKPGALLEDSDLTLSFYRHGYRICFAEDAIAYHQVPETVSGYIKQHIRWGRGFNAVSQDHLGFLLQDQQLALKLRVELALFATGYLDRLALLGALSLVSVGYLSSNLLTFPLWIIYIALVAPFIQIIALLSEQRSPLAMWKRLLWIPVFFFVDIYAALRSFIETLGNRPQVWRKTERI